MRIAQVAPLYESVPPSLYGGTERVVSYLTEELVQQGHEVTLFASADSVTRARLIPSCHEALRLDKTCIDTLSHHVRMLEQVLRERDKFDVIHFHVDYIHYSMSRREQLPALTTLHGRLDIADLVPLYREFSEVPVVSISNSQRGPLPWLNWQGTVYHGLPEDLFTFRAEPGSYLAFLGRTSPEKGLEEAIEIACMTGLTLKIAAKIDRVDREYFSERITPLLRNSNIEFIGEIGDDQKNAFLGEALALLFPIQWPEPFGLVMIESMACGTPVIAYPSGSVPEIISEGDSGFLVNNKTDAARAIEKLSKFNRHTCREYFDRRFSATRMANDYIEIYERIREANPDALTAPDGVLSWMKSA